jgi:hypothetical protein
MGPPKEEGRRNEAPLPSPEGCGLALVFNNYEPPNPPCPSAEGCGLVLVLDNSRFLFSMEGVYDGKDYQGGTQEWEAQ